MNLRLLSRLCGLALISVTAAHGQISATLRLNKTQYVAGEAVIGVVTITNNSGQDQVFQTTTRMPWLDFVIKDGKGEPTTPKGRVGFGAVKIPAGQTMAREVVLNSFFQLSDPGSYSVYGVVRTPGQMSEGFSTNRLLFNLSAARPYWTQKVGVKGNASKLREFRVLNYSGNQKTELYVQVMDCATGTSIQTYSIGEVLMFRKPQITVDRNQVLHVFFLSGPTMWTHIQVDTNGKLLKREFHIRGPQGDPQLLAMRDGSIGISNSIPYDPKAAAEAKAKVRKASDRPAGF
jgi:hypothetical protein